MKAPLFPVPRSGASLILLLLLAMSCIDPYTPSTTITDYRILVIDGFYNSSDTTRIELTRSQTIQSTNYPDPETRATVSVDEEGGASAVLAESSFGVYTLPPGRIDNSKNVRLHIRLSSGIEYASEYVPVRTTPPIDSVTWKHAINDGDSGILITANTHDVSNQTRYYRWTYTGTWEYSSHFRSDWIRLADTIVLRPVDISHCWQSENAPGILVSSTTALSQDIVSEYPLLFINKFSPKLSYRYSMLLKQYALTKEAYEYWLTLQKNTENIGTIFGPLPSQVNGNISCITDSSIPALGFFSACSESSTRFNVYQTEFAGVNHYDDSYQDCVGQDMFVPIVDALKPTSYLYLYQVYVGLTLIGYQTAPPDCTDCRLHGGTITVPAWW